MNGGRDDGTPLRNPFSAMAVARVAGSEDDAGGSEFTVETDAIRRATAHLTEYLDAPDSAAGRGPGAVLLVLGELGTGKTHLARQLVRTAAARLADRTRSLHIEATAENVLSTYQRFLLQLGLERVRARVSEFYADIVAEQLQDTGLAGHAVDLLRRREVEPRKVVDELRLMESQLLRRVHRELSDVTENESFGKALTLLLRPGFEDAVWKWLTGGEPDVILRERDITTRIAAAPDVLEAMGVFALLFGGSRRRFVLVVDEFDKIFSLARHADDRVMLAFQKMLEVFSNAGAFLVLCGHPDFLTMLDASARQRITHTVPMTGLSVPQAREFIELAQRAEFGQARLEPFTPDVVEYVTTLAGGNVRRVIRMCHTLFQMTEGRGLVTDEMVRAAAREQLGPLSADEVLSSARRVLVHNGWTYQPDHYLSLGRDSRVDFWLTFADRTGGCAVLFTDSVLTHPDVEAVRRRFAAVRQAHADAEVVLVVNGVVAGDVAPLLRGVLGREPVVYSGRRFTDDLQVAVRAAMTLLPAEQSADPAGLVQQRIDQINRQQSSLYGFVEQLADHIDGLRTSSDRRLAEIQHQLTDLAAGTPREAASVELPGPVAQLFDDALGVLEENTHTELMTREAFARGPESSRVLDAVQRRQRTPGYLEALGIVTLLQQALHTFRDGVQQWYADVRAREGGGELSAGAVEELDEICRTYDAVVEYLPRHKLDPLVQLAPWTARGGPVSDLSRPSRRASLRTHLDNLSTSVRRAAVRSLTLR
ncbi:AAA family ATPase [Saccharothrix sp. NPDC042600]|uniref:AAA family ATPase n=1 Tax=Saccharothrix TaxID=2071 RepID=UPI003408091E|nr:hypothetical protein GCM10017745_60090 [Saccharothrix mutabilis subsp. capreolus]